MNTTLRTDKSEALWHGWLLHDSRWAGYLLGLMLGTMVGLFTGHVVLGTFGGVALGLVIYRMPLERFLPQRKNQEGTR